MQHALYAHACTCVHVVTWRAEMHDTSDASQYAPSDAWHLTPDTWSVRQTHTHTTEHACIHNIYP